MYHSTTRDDSSELHVILSRSQIDAPFAFKTYCRSRKTEKNAWWKRPLHTCVGICVYPRRGRIVSLPLFRRLLRFVVAVRGRRSVAPIPIVLQVSWYRSVLNNNETQHAVRSLTVGRPCRSPKLTAKTVEAVFHEWASERSCFERIRPYYFSTNGQG